MIQEVSAIVRKSCFS